jgi:Family of unknown function (DUF6172)
MKKTFPLKEPGKVDARVVEAVKFEVRKYLKRERRKKLPEGFDQWDFSCKVGPDQAVAETKSVKEVFLAIDAVAKTEVPLVYVEVIAAAGKRFPAAVVPTAVVTETTPPPEAAPKTE